MLTKNRARLKKSLRKSSEKSLLKTSEVQLIANDLLDAAKLATERAVAHLDHPDQENFPQQRNTLEQIILKRLQTLKPEAQARARTWHKKQATGNKSARISKITTRESTSVLEQLRKLPPAVDLALDTITKEGFMGVPLGAKRKDLEGAQVMAKSGGLPDQVLYRELELRVRKLKCIETTSGSGKDEITLDGIGISANGTTKGLKAMLKEKEFDSGEAKSFSPPKAFARFKFKNDNTVAINGQTYEVGWPRNYAVTVLMAEIDNGEFPEFVKDMMEELKSAAIAEVKAAIAGAIGTAATPVVGAIVAALVWVAGKITDWIITEFTSFIIELWEDDAFMPLTASFEMAKPAPDSGDPVQKRKSLWWKQHGGHYELEFEWHFNDAYTATPLEAAILSPGVINWHPISNSRKKRAEVFMRGLDHKIYRAYHDNNQWSNWETFPNENALFQSAPTVCSWKAGRLELFALGNDNKVYQNSLNNYEWSGWNKAQWNNFVFRFSPAAISRKKNYVDVFAVGMDRRIYNFFWDGQTWSGIRTDLPEGTFMSAPAVVSRGADRLDVVAMGDDRKMYISSWELSWGKWSPWSAIGDGTFTSAPSICNWDENRLHLFGRGDDRKIYHAHYKKGSGWTGWSDEMSKSNATFLSGPTAVSTKPGLIDLYAIGDDQSMWRNVFNGTKWSGWFNDFEPGTFK